MFTEDVHAENMIRVVYSVSSLVTYTLSQNPKGYGEKQLQTLLEYVLRRHSRVR